MILEAEVGFWGSCFVGQFVLQIENQTAGWLLFQQEVYTALEICLTIAETNSHADRSETAVKYNNHDWIASVVIMVEWNAIK